LGLLGRWVRYRELLLLLCFAASNRQKEASSSSESFSLSLSLSLFLSFVCHWLKGVRISHINARVLSWYTIQEQAELVLNNNFSEIFTQIRKKESFGYTRSDDANVQTNVGWFFDFCL
jgi:hypothetical protein